MPDSLPPDGAQESYLLERITSGDDAALGVLYDAHAPVLFGLALRLTGDGQDAEDVVASVFRAVWQEPLETRGCGVTVRAWLVSLCRRIAGERPRQPRLVSSTNAGRSSSPATGEVAEYVLALPSAEDAVRRDRVNAAMEELRPEERQVLDLVYLDGLTVEDVAQRLALSSHSARQLVNSAMHALRLALRPAAIS
jgi:RNA polymerase sigma-70 factor (ECF subfamily)